MIRLCMPYPPSVGVLYRIAGNRMHMTTRGRRYKEAVRCEFLEQCHGQTPAVERISVDFRVIVPDHRRRDLDNLGKILLDSLEGLAYLDDSQIDDLRFVRCGVEKPGCVRATIRAIDTAGNSR